MLPRYGVEIFAVIHDDALRFLVDVDLLDVALGHLLQRLFRPRLPTLTRNQDRWQKDFMAGGVTSNQSMVQQLMSEGK